MELIINPDKEHVKKILKSISSKENHCCCQIIKDEKSICPFVNHVALSEKIEVKELCINGQEKQECFCDLYIKEE